MNPPIWLPRGYGATLQRPVNIFAYLPPQSAMPCFLRCLQVVAQEGCTAPKCPFAAVEDRMDFPSNASASVPPSVK